MNSTAHVHAFAVAAIGVVAVSLTAPRGF